ncbi:methyl farnesoate epoxidase [Halyomorpha halys]|uniref:methyl farnesoate epoxidase n=1 Tax=Halyomorpha halys TaxID=286706 RepID=UPI0006D4FBE9|nr:methyl farnesoate epoxidase-like [Halyomorpha halys]
MWFLVLFIALLALLVLESRRPPRFPPGPPWVPILGNYWLFYKLRQKLGFTHLVWESLSKRYGPLLGVRLGNDKLVIGTNLHVVKELLTKEQFDARPDGFFFQFRAFGERYGLVFVDGDFFNEQKRFVMKHLKSFGLNRSIMEDKISAETEDLVQHILKHCKDGVDLPSIFDISIMNILWSLVSGRRFELDDKKAQVLIDTIHASFRLQDMSGGILNQMPFLRFICPELTSFNKLKAVLTKLTSFVKGIVDEHQKTVSSYENRDLIDAFLNEMKKHEGNKSTFTEKQLIILLLDLFLAGPETSTATLGFAVLYLLHYPHVQTKLQNELDAVIGKGNQVTMKDKPRLIYLEAFTMELLRCINVTPTTVSHRAKEDAEVLGYRIPKDSIVLANLYSLHMDKDYWGDPENFRPERFIDENGAIIQHDNFIPFGLGKRRCMGEALAKTTIFLFLTSLMQKFRFRPISQELPPIKSLDGATISPASFRCLFEPRE